VEVAETFVGLVVGHAVIIKSGVEVAVRVLVEVVVGNAVTTKRGVDVAEGPRLTVVELVMVGVADSVKVVVAVPVGVEVGGRALGETDAASFPTVISSPQTYGCVMVAE
jgi:hypothetical protein